MGSLKTLRFEPLSDAHIARVVEIEAVSNGAPWSERSFRSELTSPQSVFRVAIESGRVVGYAGLWLIVDEAHITTVAVDPEMRRKGIGRHVVVEILKLAQEAGMLCATLEVRAGNAAALALYEKLGFERVAIRKGYYPDNKEDAVVMWLYGLKDWRP